MKRHTFLVPAALGAAMALSGCSTFVGAELAPAGQPTTVLIVNNNSGMPINALTISKCNAMSHGLNRLSSGDYIPQGGSRSFRITAGCWDVMAGSTSGMANANQRYNAELGTPARITFGPVQ